MKKQVFFFLLCIAGSAFSENNDATFTYQGQAINPACIGMFNSSLSDFPYIKSINLSACQNSNAAAKKTLKNKQGELYYYENDKDASEGSYGYKVVGKSKNGIYVLSTYKSGGGTGIFTQLLLVKMRNSSLYVFNGHAQPEIQTIIRLSLLGYVNGGDRCLGSFSKVEVEGHELKIQKYLGATPNDCSKTTSFSIDLSPLTL